MNHSVAFVLVVDRYALDCSIYSFYGVPKLLDLDSIISSYTNTSMLSGRIGQSWSMDLASAYITRIISYMTCSRWSNVI